MSKKKYQEITQKISALEEEIEELKMNRRFSTLEVGSEIESHVLFSQLQDEVDSMHDIFESVECKIPIEVDVSFDIEHLCVRSFDEVSLSSSVHMPSRFPFDTTNHFIEKATGFEETYKVMEAKAESVFAQIKKTCQSIADDLDCDPMEVLSVTQ